jgi:hypothetical protein
VFVPPLAHVRVHKETMKLLISFKLFIYSTLNPIFHSSHLISYHCCSPSYRLPIPFSHIFIHI